MINTTTPSLMSSALRGAGNGSTKATRRACMAGLVVAAAGAWTYAYAGDQQRTTTDAILQEFQLLPFVLRPTEHAGVAVDIGDVSGDGRADVVLTTESSDSSLYLYAQDETGQLQAPSIKSAAGNSRTGIAIVDLDGANGLDVVLGTATGLSLFRSTALGGLDDATAISSRPAYYIEAMDLDGNGTTDLASTTWSDQGSIHLNQGNGQIASFDWAIPVAGYNSTASGDLDGDGDADIAVASAQGSRFIFLHRNIGNGTLQSVRFLTIECAIGGAKGVAIGDFNSDGLADVAASAGGNLPQTCLSVFYGQGNYQFSEATVFATYEIPGVVRAADMNRDGRQDLVVLHEIWQRLGVYLQNSNGGLNDEVLYPLPGANSAHAEALALGDIDSDGCTDVAYANLSGLVTLQGTGCDPLYANGFEGQQ